MLALLALLAEAYRENGQSEEGLRVIAEALDHVAQTGIVYYEAELHPAGWGAAAAARHPGRATSGNELPQSARNC
jgi:hypothetical protein